MAKCIGPLDLQGQTPDLGFYCGERAAWQDQEGTPGGTSQRDDWTSTGRGGGRAFDTAGAETGPRCLRKPVRAGRMAVRQEAGRAAAGRGTPSTLLLRGWGWFGVLSTSEGLLGLRPGSAQGWEGLGPWTCQGCSHQEDWWPWPGWGAGHLWSQGWPGHG